MQKKIVYVTFDKGSTHDFSLFKESTIDINTMIGDSGYQGLDKILSNNITPKKKSKNNPLTDQDKDFIHLISTIRISIEHVNSQLKVFKILSISKRYRNRNTFFNRALFLCSLYNFCLDSFARCLLNKSLLSKRCIR